MDLGIVTFMIKNNMCFNIHLYKICLNTILDLKISLWKIGEFIF